MSASIISGLGISYFKQQNEDDEEEAGIKIEGEDSLISYETFLDMLSKDSIVYVVDSTEKIGEEEFWCTKEFYTWNYVYPDTIVVPFTRNGVVEDSVEAVKWDVLQDSTGHVYSPLYVFISMTGDTWQYDINGKFVRHTCNPRNHIYEEEPYHP